jgi:CRP-like cAMP-binding protein
MNDPAIRDLIQQSSLAGDLDAGQCDDLAAIAGEHTLEDGELLIEQGRRDETMYIIAAGELAVQRRTGGGDTATLHVLRPGDLAGVMGFVDGTEHTATLRAMGATRVVTITRQDLESLLDSKPGVVYGVMRGIVRTVHRILREMNLQSVELSNYITQVHGRY